jgi:hyperosmotically inducible periplasmic protein
MKFGKERAMNRKHLMLVAALAAAALVTGGCEQRTQRDNFGQKPGEGQTSVMGKLGQSGSADQGATGQSSAGSKLTAADDTMITTKVRAALLAEPGLKSAQIDVATKDATVTLSGPVDSDIVRDRAKQIALSTEGVKNVVDNMNLKMTG